MGIALGKQGGFRHMECVCVRERKEPCCSVHVSLQDGDLGIT